MAQEREGTPRLVVHALRNGARVFVARGLCQRRQGDESGRGGRSGTEQAIYRKRHQAARNQRRHQQVVCSADEGRSQKSVIALLLDRVIGTYRAGTAAEL